MGIFETLQYLGGGLWFYGGAFILVLSILVFVHEWGHYIVARLCNVRVEVFSIGFGRELFGFDDKAGTRWKVSLVPLGGYVKLYGDTDPASAGHSDQVEDKESGAARAMTAEEKEVAFFSKPVWQRSLIVFAGPAINYIFAIILLAGLFAFNGQPVTPPAAGAVMGGSSAEKAGFQPHDLVRSINGADIQSFEDIRRAMMIGLDGEKHFVVERDGELVDIHARPERVESEDRFGFMHSRGLLGLVSPRHALRVDTITSVDGRAVENADEAVAAIQSRMGTTFNVSVKAGEEDDILTIRPLEEFNTELGNADSPESGVLFISSYEGDILKRYSPGGALLAAVRESYSITVGTLEALGQMIVGTRSAKELGGVIRIGALAGDMAQQGLIALILFTALLSINLGLINLFPIPMLDGGHLVFYAVEAMLGRPVPEVMQEYAFRFGLMFLVCLMVFANFNDIIQLLT